MQGFQRWLAEGTRIPDGAIRIDLPTARQTTKYSCGAAALRSIGEFYGLGQDDERQWIALVKATPELGANPADIIQAAKHLGFRVEHREGMTLAQVEEHLDLEHPVICSIQAWGRTKGYPRDQSGHYVVAIGYDARNIYCMDPSTGGDRGVIPRPEFLRRWHDKDDGRKYHRLGIAVYKDRAGTAGKSPDTGARVR